MSAECAVASSPAVATLPTKELNVVSADIVAREAGDLGSALEIVCDGSDEEEPIESTSSGETSPLGLSLLYLKRARQFSVAGPEKPLQPIETATEGSELENQGVETSPLGKALLDRKRYHARRRQQREGAELRDMANCMNAEAGIAA
jgi:hypothetical protein